MARRPSARRTSTRRQSECIAGISYDKDSKVLDITFQQRGSHTYHDVPADVAAALQRSSSKGVYFNAVIRPNY